MGTIANITSLMNFYCATAEFIATSNSLLSFFPSLIFPVIRFKVPGLFVPHVRFSVNNSFSITIESFK